MRGIRRKRVLLVSAAIILLCFGIIGGMTWALFTDTESLNHHLRAGELDITLWRTHLETITLDRASGYLVKTEMPADVDFSNTNDNVFDLTDDSLIVPCSVYTAEMKIVNNSDVAFRYWFELDFAGGSTMLANQLKMTITTQSGIVKEFWMHEGCILGSEDEPISVLARGGAQTFTVKVEFVDDRTPNADFVNNDVMNKASKFDLIIHAVQEVTVQTLPEK